MTYYMHVGNTVKVFDDREIKVVKTLSPDPYILKQNPMSKEYYLEGLNDFSLPDKLYGDVDKKANRILSTFKERSTNTGVMLSGVKGSGKTLLSKKIAQLAAQENMPTIIISECHHGDEFNKFIQQINMPCVIIFDEFEKVYGWNYQEKILSLLDGVYNSKKLIIFTVNKSDAVTSFLKNRPGRVYYHYNFKSLDMSFIQDYLNDNLNDKSQIEYIYKYLSVYTFFTFDMLSACVEEMNRYGESFKEVLNHINVSGETSEDTKFNVFLEIPKLNYREKVSTIQQYNPNEFKYYLEWSDLDQSLVSPEYREKYKEMESEFNNSVGDNEDESPMHEFTSKDLVSINPIVYQFGEIKLLIEQEKSTFSYISFL